MNFSVVLDRDSLSVTLIGDVDCFFLLAGAADNFLIGEGFLAVCFIGEGFLAVCFTGEGFLAVCFTGEAFLETAETAFATDALAGEGFAEALAGETLLFITTSLRPAAVDFAGDLEGDLEATDDFFTDLGFSSTITASNEIGIAKPRPGLSN